MPGMSSPLAGLLIACLCCCGAGAANWPQWGGHDGRNMASDEKSLPSGFEPGERDPQGNILAGTSRNIRWVTRLGADTCTSPVIANGRIFLGTMEDGRGVLTCFDEASGAALWRWVAPPRIVPAVLNGSKFWFGTFPPRLGICSTAAVDGDRVYIVTHRLEVLCLDVKGQVPPVPSLAVFPRPTDAAIPPVRAPAALPTTAPTSQPTLPFEPKVLWMFDMWNLGVRPSDACNCSVIVHGDLVYVGTSNGVDRDADARKKDEFRKPPAPDAPSLIALNKLTGILAATDGAGIGPRLLHGQWSSPSLGQVNGRTLIFYGGGDGVCYAFEALPAMPEKPVKLKTAWSFDCNPPEYKVFGDLDLITHYALGDRRRSDSINKKQDGAFVGMSEIIATPVFHEGRMYVAIGRDPEHGRGRGALWCIDASGGSAIWCYKRLDRTLSTVSVAGGLVYVCDVAGRVHCVDAATGEPCWIHETGEKIWGSTMVADAKVYVPTDRYLWTLAAGRELKIIDKTRSAPRCGRRPCRPTACCTSRRRGNCGRHTRALDGHQSFSHSSREMPARRNMRARSSRLMSPRCGLGTGSVNIPRRIAS